VQTSQMQAASDMLSKVSAEREKENVLNCVTLFQNNSMRALEAYFGNVTGVPAAASAPISVPDVAPASAPVVVPTPVVTPAPAPVATTVEKPIAAPIAEPTKEVPVQAAKPSADMYALITEAIAEKTGYPTDMIDEDMELESDLGIDSIKRVEILSTVNNALGGIFTKENVEELSGISVIAEMVTYLKSIADTAPAPAVEVTKEAPVQTVKPSVDMYALVTEAIAEKTGYPTDMIDEDMELESDLGIDSIKRVEILSMVNNTLGGIFTKENVEELSGISVIAEMVTYLKSIVDIAPSVDAKSEPAAEISLAEEATSVKAETESSAVSGGKVTECILAAIADKTGYPEEMIETDMELEADLGIDSIKRVEIFADVLKKLGITLTPDQTEGLSAMSTVEEIAVYLSEIV